MTIFRVPFNKTIIPAILAVALLIAPLAANAQVTLLDHGQSNYVIIIPDSPAPQELKAAEVFSEHFWQATGIRLEIFSDQSFPAEQEIIIGQNSRLGQFRIKTHTDKLSADGFVILTKDKRLIIAGGTPAGTLNGVYGFLEEYLGFRKYTPDFTFVPKTEKIVLPKLKDVQGPVFSYRETYFPGRQDAQFREWHKLHTHQSGPWGLWVHTFDDLVPPKDYFREHPEYFSEINGRRIADGQLCLTHPGVFEVLTENLRKRMGKKPNALYWSVSQNDNYLACQCAACKEAVNHYGGQSGLMISFVNRVAELFPEKIISTLAYQYTRQAPKSIRPHPNVNIMLCSIECNRSLPLEEDPSSAAFVQDVKDWSHLTDNILIWDYVVQFRNYISPFPNLRVLQPNLAFFADEDCRMMFQQGSGSSLSEFSELRTYLIAKLLWDPEQDAEEIMGDFMAGYYRSAAPFLNDYIRLMHDELESSGDNLWIYGFPYSGIDSYLRPELIPEYERLFDLAEEAVSDDPVVLKRVKAARLPLEFAILDIALNRKNDYPSWIRIEQDRVVTDADLLNRLNLFVNDCAEAGIAILNEQGLKPDEYRETVHQHIIRSEERSLGLNKQVTLLTDFSPKYDVGGAAALTDGLRGIEDYHFNWLGFEGNDLEAVIDLGGEMTVQQVSASFLQDLRSWIFLPLSFEVEYSLLGFTYAPAGKDINITPDNKSGSFVQTFSVAFSPVQARYIKIKANSMKTCPAWHLGKGLNSWIFTDEVIIK